MQSDRNLHRFLPASARLLVWEMGGARLMLHLHHKRLLDMVLGAQPHPHILSHHDATQVDPYSGSDFAQHTRMYSLRLLVRLDRSQHTAQSKGHSREGNCSAEPRFRIKILSWKPQRVLNTIRP
jgi:hypothetical protein